MKKYLAGVSGLIIALLVILGLSMIPFKTQNTNKKPIRVITSLNFYGEVASQVAGQYGQVTSLINNSAVDPHDYQPGTSQARKVGDANIIIENGLGYDQWLAQLVKSNQHHGQKVINIGQLMGKQTGQNEHLWYQPETIKKLTQDLAYQFGQLDPVHKDYYQRNAQQYLKSLRPLEQEINQVKRNVNKGQSKVAVSEPVFDYALESLGYHVINPHFEKAIEDGNDPSPQDIKQLQDAIKNHQIAFFVENAQTSDHVVNGLVKLAQQNHVPVLKVTETKPKNAKNYQEWMLSQYRALAKIQQGEK